MTRGCICTTARRRVVGSTCETCGYDLAEVQIQDAIRLAVGSDSGVVLWRNNVGTARLRDGATVRYGVCNPGGADLIGILDGRFFAVEVKSRLGRTSPDQDRFGALVRARGGVHVVARSADDVLRAIKEHRGH